MYNMAAVRLQVHPGVAEYGGYEYRNLLWMLWQIKPRIFFWQKLRYFFAGTFCGFHGKTKGFHSRHYSDFRCGGGVNPQKDITYSCQNIESEDVTHWFIGPFKADWHVCGRWWSVESPRTEGELYICMSWILRKRRFRYRSGHSRIRLLSNIE